MRQGDGGKTSEVVREVLGRNMHEDAGGEDEVRLSVAYLAQAVRRDDAEHGAALGDVTRRKARQAFDIESVIHVEPDVIAGLEIVHEGFADPERAAAVVDDDVVPLASGALKFREDKLCALLHEADVDIKADVAVGHHAGVELTPSRSDV